MTRFEKIIATLVITCAIVVVVGLVLWSNSAQAAPTTVQIQNGGTSTSTLPTYGQVLVGGKSGEYELVATSTFGGGGSGAVSSVFGRTGVVSAQSGDYTTSLVTEGSNLYFTNARAVTALTGQNVSIFTNDAHYLTSLTGAASSTLLGDTNTFSGNDAFTNLITGSISGNAGTVTNGVYTTTFGTLFDNRLSATTTLPNIITLSHLSLPYSQLTGTPLIGSTTLLGDANTFTGIDNFTNASSNFSGTWQTFSPAHFQSALTTPTWPIILSGATISFGGLSTTSAFTQGQIPTITGVNTFGEEATGSITCNGTASCATTGLSVLGGALTITGTGNTFSYPFPLGATSSLVTFTGGVILNNATNTITNFAAINGTTTNATSTNLSTTIASTTNLVVSLIRNALHLGGADGTVSAYGGSNCSAGNAPTGLNANGTVNGCTAYLAGNQTITLSGDVTGSGATAITTTIAANHVTYADIQTVGANKLLGNVTSATANVGEISTSTLFGTPTPGTILAFLNGQNGYVSTTTLNIGGNAGTATALAANGTNCSAGNYPLGVDASGNVEGCTTANLGTITGVTATYPILSSGGTTPIISTAFGTTTPNGIGNNVVLYNSNSGVMQGASTSTLNIGGNAGTATALAANGTNCIAGFFSVGVDASGNAEGCTYAVSTTTPWSPNQLVYLTNNGREITAASSTLDLPSSALQTTGVSATSYTCTNLTVNAEGQITTASNGSCSGGSSFGYPFTNPTEFATTTAATTTPLWAQEGLFASSTSQFANSSTSLATISTLFLTNPLSTQYGGTGLVNPGGSSADALLEFGGSTGASVISPGAQYTIVQSVAGGSGFTVDAVHLNQSAAVTGTLPVTNGGTGVATLTVSQLLYGNGTNAMSSVATSSTGVAGTILAINLLTGATIPYASSTLATISKGANIGTTTSDLSRGVGFSIGTTTLAGAQTGFYMASSTCSTGACSVNWNTDSTSGSSGERFIMTGNITLTMNSTSSEPVAGIKELEMCQDGTGSRSLTFADPTHLRWGTLGTTTLATTPNTCTFILFQFESYWYSGTGGYFGLASTTGALDQ